MLFLIPVRFPQIHVYNVALPLLHYHYYRSADEWELGDENDVVNSLASRRLILRRIASPSRSRSGHSQNKVKNQNHIAQPQQHHKQQYNNHHNQLPQRQQQQQQLQLGNNRQQMGVTRQANDHDLHHYSPLGENNSTPTTTSATTPSANATPDNCPQLAVYHQRHRPSRHHGGLQQLHLHSSPQVSNRMEQDGLPPRKVSPPLSHRQSGWKERK